MGGPEAGLVNLSRGGALMEVPGRLSLGAAVRVKLMKTGREMHAVSGRVAWLKVASIAGGQINYRVAVAFDEPLEALMPGDACEVAEGTETPEADGRDRAPAIVQFPSAATQSKPRPVALAAVAVPDADIDTLRKKLAAAKADLSCQAAVLESLSTKLRDSEQQRTALIRQLAEAQQRGDSLQAAWDAREQEHAQALRTQQTGHEAIVAELMKATNDQQAEFQALLEQQPHRAEGDAGRRALESRVEAAEARCAAQQDRYRALRWEAEKLMRLIDAAADCRLDVSETMAS